MIPSFPLILWGGVFIGLSFAGAVLVRFHSKIQYNKQIRRNQHANIKRLHEAKTDSAFACALSFEKCDD